MNNKGGRWGYIHKRGCMLPLNVEYIISLGCIRYILLLIGPKGCGLEDTEIIASILNLNVDCSV